MTIKISEHLANFLKEAKLKLMVGGVIGAVALGAGATTVSYAQSNASISSETNMDLDDEKIDFSSDEIPEVANSKLFGAFIHNTDFANLENIIAVDFANFANSEDKQIIKMLDNEYKELLYYFQNGVGTSVDPEISMNFAIKLQNILNFYTNGAELNGFKFEQLNDKEYAIVTNYNQIRAYAMCVDRYFSSCFTNQQIELLEQFANLTDKEIENITNVKASQKLEKISSFAKSFSLSQDLDYSNELKQFLNNDLSVENTSLSKYINAVSRGMYLNSGEEEIAIYRDTIVSLNLNNLDSETLEELYAGEFDEAVVNRNADYKLLELSMNEWTGLDNFTFNAIDKDVLCYLDERNSSEFEKFLEDKNTKIDFDECYEFFLNNGEINGHKFSELTDSGKVLALVNYSRLRSVSMCKDFTVGTNEAELYESMNVNAVSTLLGTNNLFSKYSNFVYSKSETAFGGDSFGNLGHIEETIKSNSEKGLISNVEEMKSTMFVNNLNTYDYQNVSNVISVYGQNIDLNVECENMNKYLNSVLEHNVTHDISKNIDINLFSQEKDRYSLSMIESCYKALKYQSDYNQINENSVYAITNWLSTYYQKTYQDANGNKRYYTDDLSYSGIFLANHLLNECKVVLSKMNVKDVNVQSAIENVKNISMANELNMSYTVLSDNFDMLTNNLNNYTVKKGDTLTKISKMYNVSINDLVELNNIENPDLILIGQQLKTNPQYKYEQGLKR